eukprot:gb/GFBE01000072.1/.p1 GENE.gb/GFBE01000072.1/~~gb/GFBE01000072.1/.p1  ORF type:complete len:932 (+),score=227.65 gb/GFBE01000072.1/:1-2796(+)
MQQFQQLASAVWDEVYAEILIIGLFCVGFLLFRVGTQRKWFCPEGVHKKPAPAMPVASTARRQGSQSAAGARRRGGAESQPRGENSAFHAKVQKVRTALDKRSLKDALSAIAGMHYAGHVVPGSCLVSLLCLGKESAQSAEASWAAAVEVLRQLPRGAVCCDNISGLAQHAVNSGDVTLARQVHALASEAGIVLPAAACESLLRGYAASGDSNAADIFDELLVQPDGTGAQRSTWQPSEAALAAVAMLCADSRSVRLAERLMAYSRRQYGAVALSLYSALLKVYSQAKAWDKACRLYDGMRQDGVSPDTAVYGMLIKAAVESGRPAMAKQLFQESSNPDVLNYMSMIRSAGREKNVAKALNLLDEFERSPCPIDPAAYNCALEACVAAGDRTAAEALLLRMEDADQVDVVSYNTYIKGLLIKKAHKEVQQVLLAMRARGIEPNVVTYNSMVKDATARQDMARAWELADEMKEMKVLPDAYTCSILMAGIKHMPSGEGVDRIIALMKHGRVTADEVLLNCMLDVCVRLRDTERLLQVLDECRASSTVPSLHACATLIRAYGHAQRLDEAWVLWRRVSSEIDGPSEEAFISMVNACLASSDLAAASKIFQEMRGRLAEFPRAAVAFSLTVKTAVQLRKVDLAIQIYQETRGTLTLGTVTYNTLIDSLVRAADLRQAMELFKDMTTCNVAPDVITYSILIKGYSTVGDLERAITLLGQMQRCGIKPDAILFNSILHGCAQCQKRALTEQVLEDMDKAGIAPSNFTLSILVKLYGRCGDLEAAVKATEVYPAKYGFDLNAQVYTCLMSTCISAGDLAKAFDVYQRMRADGCKADAKTYETLLHGCIRLAEPERAAQIMEEALSHEGACLKTDTLESAVVMAHNRGRPDLATSMVESMKVAGLSPSSRLVTSMAREPRAAAVRPRQRQGRPAESKA